MDKSAKKVYVRAGSIDPFSIEDPITLQPINSGIRPSINVGKTMGLSSITLIHLLNEPILGLNSRTNGESSGN